MENIQYVVDEHGKQVAVLLNVVEYERLIKQLTTDVELLIGLSQAELEALAESMLAPAAQTRLNELLADNQIRELLPVEITELNYLLEQVEQLTILKTRARYTLNQQASLTTAV